MKFFAFALAALMTAPAPLSAQPSIIVAGRVTDPSGGVVPAAAIEVLARGRIITMTSTDADGRYQVALPPGVRYELRVRSTGFADQILELTPTTDTFRDVALQIAAIGDTLVVTASRMPERRFTTTESLTVITAGEIAASGAAQLADILRHAPGLSVESTGREGAVASLFARGGESDYNHVLIDGVRVNANGGQFDFSRISAGEIERVEVVRGAQSALYGSDAIGSVVQVFTRRAAPGDSARLSGSFEAGSFNTRRGDLHVFGGARNRLDYQLGVAYRGTDGAFGDVLPEDDRFDETTLTGGLGTILSDRATLRTGVRYGDGQGHGVGPIVYGSRDTGTAADTTELSWHVDFTHQLTSAVMQTATMAYFRGSRVSADRVPDPSFTVFAVLAGRPGAIFPDSPRLVRLVDERTFNAMRAGTQLLPAGQFLAWTPFGVADFAFTSEAELRRPAFKYQLNARWGNGQTASGGYEFERERDALAAGFLVENHAYFGQQQFQLRDRWFATVGARVDDNSRFGTELSPKASLGGFVRPFRNSAVSSVKVFTNLGRGIKTPLFGELFGDPFSDGNPDLHPERARTFDAGAELTFDSQRWLARVAYFNNRFTDQVAFRSTGLGLDGRPDFVNIEGSTADGWEFEALVQRPFRGLTAGGGYSLVNTEVVASVRTSEQFQPGQPLLRRPKHSGTFHASYIVRRAAVHLQARFVGERHDAAFIGLAAVPSPGSPITTERPVDITVNPAYTVVGVGGDYRIRDDLTLFVRVDNVTNEAYEGALGYPGLPRSAMVGARFVLGGR